jgi:putative two-component system response regulator
MKVLIADDNPFYLCALGETLRGWGYEVVPVNSGNAAWDVLRQDNAPKLAVLDWMMPGLDGPEVCRRVRALQQPEPPYLIVLTSKEGKKNAIAALSSGADDYLTKPFDRDELQARVRVGARIAGLQTSQTAVFIFARAVEAKSPYTQGHADRVTQYALLLAEEVGVVPAEKEVLRRGGLLHDIGKISVPDAILDKPGPLTPEERRVMEEHPAQGVKIIEPLESLRDVIPLIRWHHERLDGRGYPDGIKGDAIPLLVRILSVADVYDALKSERPYRPALGHARCVEILRSDAAGGGLDADLVERFCQVMATLGSAGLAAAGPALDVTLPATTASRPRLPTLASIARRA